MNLPVSNSLSSLLRRGWLLAVLGLTTSLTAADDQPATIVEPAEQPVQPAQPATPAEIITPEQSAATAAPVAPTEPAAPAPAGVPPAPDSDKPADSEEQLAEVAPSDEVTKDEPEVDDAAEASKEPIVIKNRRWKKHHSGNERVSVGEDATLGAGESADAVVSVFGTARSSGTVRDAVVSVLGQTRVEGGRVGDAAVAVLGNSYINGEIGAAVVAIAGNVELGPEAVVHGEIVCIGGQLKQDPKAVVKGKVMNFPQGFDFNWFRVWFSQCVLKARLLAFDANVLWAWWIALGFLGFYSLLALLFPESVENCARTLEERPGKSLLAALLTLLLSPVAYLLLTLTLAVVVGFVLLPVFSFTLFLAALFGKGVMLLWLGRRLTRLASPGVTLHPMLGVLLGGALVLVLYTVPVLSFVLYKLLGIIGLGVVVYTVLRSFRRDKTVAAGVPALAPVQVVSSPDASIPPVQPAAAAVPPVMLSAVTLPRAGFGLRLAASILDLIMVGIVYGMVQPLFFGFGESYLLWLTVYTVVMWATKGTTIGGIICGLKVVRTDDRPLDWTVAIVRGLSAYLSLFVGGLGFVWVIFDDEKQSWHDKIAGTTIVRVPKGASLL